MAGPRVFRKNMHADLVATVVGSIIMIFFLASKTITCKQQQCLHKPMTPIVDDDHIQIEST